MKRNYQVEYNGRTLFQCPECGLHYVDWQIAIECDKWCKEHHSCNLQITKHAIEVAGT